MHRAVGEPDLLMLCIVFNPEIHCLILSVTNCDTDGHSLDKSQERTWWEWSARVHRGSRERWKTLVSVMMVQACVCPAAFDPLVGSHESNGSFERYFWSLLGASRWKYESKIAWAWCQILQQWHGWHCMHLGCHACRRRGTDRHYTCKSKDMSILILCVSFVNGCGHEIRNLLFARRRKVRWHGARWTRRIVQPTHARQRAKV